jgi:hypothetical protein
MNPTSPHLPQDRAAYIPPRIQQEMAKHMEQTLPANLKYYQQSGAYVPPNVQKQMAQHMEQTMPSHLKEYINPYMQQQVVPQHLASVPGGQPTHFSPNPTSSSFDNAGQPLHPFGEQPQEASQPQQISPQLQSPQPAVQPQAPDHQDLYEFITNPTAVDKPVSMLPSLLNGKSLRTRIVILGGGLVGLLIIFSILKGLLAGSFNVQPFLAVLQDQQELIHLSSEAGQSQTSQATLPEAYQGFIGTTQLTVTSIQSQLITYLALNKQKVSAKQLNLKISTATDTQLTGASASGDYTSTFQQIMSSQLNTYTTDLRAAYAQTPGKKGRAQLNNDYRQARLLIKQLNQAGSAPVS